MRVRMFGALGLGLPLLLGACAGDVMHRGEFDAVGCHQRGTCDRLPVERLTYKEANGATHDYHLGFVEFDDQGQIQSDEQMRLVLKALKENAAPDEHQLVVVFVHGWQHNADPEDPNVHEFRNLLEHLDILERAAAARQGGKRQPRKVFGVYVGWRGESVTIPGVQAATFWTRKNAAERVGENSAKELMLKLAAYKKIANKDRSDDVLAPEKTQLIIIGHSFGGLITYRALHSLLIERALRVEPDGKTGQYRYDTAKSFGDFVLLVNPAFEGVSYEPLFHAATNRCYSSWQRPAMAIVTSQGDWATKYAFPAGRLYTFTQSAPHGDRDERAAVLNTVGHLDRYRTHWLKPRTDAASDVTAKPPQEKSIAEARAIVDQVLADRAAEEKAVATTAATAERLTTVLGDAVLEPDTGKTLPANFPYYVVSADRAIIKDHGDIWNERFFGVMRDFFIKEILGAREDQVHQPAPCRPFE